MKQLKQWQADMLLVFLTMWWGFSNVAMDICLRDMDPFTLNSFRFIVGTIIVLPFCYKSFKANINKKTVKYGILIGLSLFGTYVCSTFGVLYTNIANVGFLCGLAVIITPILNAIFIGHYPANKTKISIILSFLGVILLTLGEGFSINKANIKGDIICIGCSIFYAVDLLLTDKALRPNRDENGKFLELDKSDYVDPSVLGVIQLIFVGLLNVIISNEFFDFHLPSTKKYFAAAMFLAIFCTGISFVIQPIAQQYTTANRVGVIFTLEPVFNLLAAVIIVGESLSIRQYIGGGLMIIAIIVMEIDLNNYS